MTLWCGLFAPDTCPGNFAANRAADCDRRHASSVLGTRTDEIFRDIVATCPQAARKPSRYLEPYLGATTTNRRRACSSASHPRNAPQSRGVGGKLEAAGLLFNDAGDIGHRVYRQIRVDHQHLVGAGEECHRSQLFLLTSYRTCSQDCWTPSAVSFASSATWREPGPASRYGMRTVGTSGSKSLPRR
jgi:hypothetical protein